MSPRVTRATVGGRAYLDLQNLARRNHRPAQEYLQLYVLEGFLARLSASPFAARLVLKGGVLLAAYDVRRPTADVDLAGQRLLNDSVNVREMIVEVADLQFNDGIVFETSDATADIIRDEDAYSGVRISLNARLASARLVFHIDVNVGDPIQPAPVRIQLPDYSVVKSPSAGTRCRWSSPRRS